MNGTSRPPARPSWGCLDALEIQQAAAGEVADPAVRAHLDGCGSCRKEVRELRAAMGRPARSSRTSRAASSGLTGAVQYRRPLLKRPAFWLLLVVLAGLGVGYLMLKRKSAAPPPEPAATAEAEPAATPPKRPKARRARPARGGPPGDARIVDVIRKNQTGVRLCYERALKRDPSLSVRVEVQVDVGASGVVDRVTLDGLQPGMPLDNCIRNVIRTWRFPAAATGYEAAFPLQLQGKF